MEWEHTLTVQLNHGIFLEEIALFSQNSWRILGWRIFSDDSPEERGTDLIVKKRAKTEINEHEQEMTKL